MLKESVKWPETRQYKSRTAWEPVGFFSDCLCNASTFDLLLGFFSSSAFNVLSYGFSLFLYNGGRMRLVMNNILTEQDKATIIKGTGTDELPDFDLSDLKGMLSTLSEKGKHFFDCIAWLIRHDKIEIKLIAPKDSIGISHTKQGVFSDGLNKVSFDGSCNFSKTALIDNIESITASCDWDGVIDKKRVEKLEMDFNSIFNEQNQQIEYINVDQIKTNILSSFPDKSVDDLVKTEYKFMQEDSVTNHSSSIVNALSFAKERIDDIIADIEEKERSVLVVDDPSQLIYKKATPKFPYDSGPRPYQQQAFENWKKNGQKGLFAMATGTGKTITSLNCLLEIYKKTQCYKAIILVPTVTLVEQWEKECRKFNFSNIIKVSSKEHSWKKSLSNLLALETKDSDSSYIIISTYVSFLSDKYFSMFNGLPKNRVLLIADEAHNMGSGGARQKLDLIRYSRRIGLSATPERQFDETGNLELQKFFKSTEGYTFEFSMHEAIKGGYLCHYYYYPHIVKLTTEEFADYIEISKKIARICNRTDKDTQEVLKILLLKRKRIVHKAENKKEIFRKILQKRFEENHSLKYTLIYVPEGNQPDDFSSDKFLATDVFEDGDSDHIIDQYTQIVMGIDSHITVKEFTAESSDREETLKAFASGNIDVLTSMKCLDEGVDVPRSEFAIFCSSTGNPRQFVQRRGRVLRTHDDKDFAVIHDLIVAPADDEGAEFCDLEKALITSELLRVRDFALLSENTNDAYNEMKDILDKYQIPFYTN